MTTQSKTMTSFKHNAASEKKGQLSQKEKREKGGVSWDIYAMYIKALGGGCLMCLLMLINAGGVGSDSYSVFWLAEWSAVAGSDGAKSDWFSLGIYTAIVTGSILCLLASSLTLLHTVWTKFIRNSMMMHACKSLHIDHRHVSKTLIGAAFKTETVHVLDTVRRRPI